MIFSRRKPGAAAKPASIFIPAQAEGTHPVAAETADARHRRTDTDGAERRARQTKQDNELR